MALVIDGGERLETASTNSFGNGLDNFVLGGWIKIRAANASTNAHIFRKHTGGWLEIQVDNYAGGNVDVEIRLNYSTGDVIYTHNVGLNTWFHFAVWSQVFSSSTGDQEIWVNGSSKVTGNRGNTLTSALGTLKLGSDDATNGPDISVHQWWGFNQVPSSGKTLLQEIGLCQKHPQALIDEYNPKGLEDGFYWPLNPPWTGTWMDGDYGTEDQFLAA